jgi:c-di-AMP phosphodiesterase-like protein
MEGMEKQLTAVEWLNSEVERLTTKAGIHLSWEMMDSIIRQAKQMEKEQIIEAHGDKKRTKSNSGSCVTYSYTFTGEMYYNETFKSK